jgi:ABC-2 type transport system ATP-binding protein
LIVALARRGKTVILSSHLLADVEDVCDRVVIYYGGKVQAMGTLKELLTRPDSIRITTPVLSRETTQRVLEIIRNEVAEDKVRIDNPTQNLESYFLGVVEKARSAALETSGATSGTKVAAYLRGEAEARPTTDKVLERLTLPAAAEKKEAEPKPKPEPAVDAAKLAALTKTAEPTPPTTTESAAPAPSGKPSAGAPKPEQLSKANEKLASLLGGKKGT